jgi:uncharacterized membrane protein YgcG
VNLARILQHLATGRVALSRLFPDSALAAIEQAIESSEVSHGGEIRFAVEPGLHLLPLLKDQPARERAIEVFSQLAVWDTEHNNGVLIYLLVADRDVEIVADRGINVKVGREKWESICHEMERAFSQGKFESGVIAGIKAVGTHLREHFPSEQREQQNELSDRPVIL